MKFAQGENPLYQHFQISPIDLDIILKKVIKTLGLYCLYYGDMGCQDFKRGIQSWKDFCMKTNVPKVND